VKRFVLTPVALAAASAFSVSAQQPKIPVIQLSTIEAKGTELVTTGSAIRPMSNGSVLMNDVMRRRMLLFDPSLTSFRVVVDSATMSSNQFAMITTGLIPYTADSTLVVDMPSQSLLVIDPNGKATHPIAVPKQGDLMNLGGNALLGGTAAFDSKGRLVYRGAFRPMQPAFNPGGSMTPPAQPDTAPIVRADFDTRSVDTVAILKIAVPAKILSMTMPAPNPGASPGTVTLTGMSIKAEINPMSTGDEWAMLSDGTVAIVRAQDYHVDWIDPDGKHRSSPKMPFDWRKATDEDKQFKVDSLKNALDSAMKTQTSLPGGMGMPKLDITYAPFSEMPDYHPPIRQGSVRADADGNLWILPTTSAQGATGLVYDVINRNGELYERVQLPPSSIIAGFAPGGVVYLFHYTGTGADSKATLERARMPVSRPTN
jgi:hypothetical protein